MNQTEPLVHITLTQAEHNQLKKAMAFLITVHHQEARTCKIAGREWKELNHPEASKVEYKVGRKMTDRANRLGKLQGKIKYPVCTLPCTVYFD
jgi:hypothetical protein